MSMDTLLLTFQFFVLTPVFLCISAALSFKLKITRINFIIEFLTALILLIGSVVFIQGRYESDVVYGTGHGYPSYIILTDKRYQGFNFTEASNLTKPADINTGTGEKTLDLSMIILAIFGFICDLVFWFFIITVVHFLYKKFIVRTHISGNG